MHFHFPTTPTKYVPLRRSRSLQEVFVNAKYEKLLDVSPMKLPYNGRFFRARPRRVRLFEDDDEDLSFEKFQMMINSTKVDVSAIHSDFLKKFDEKLMTEVKKEPLSFLKKVEDMEFSKISPVVKEAALVVAPCTRRISAENFPTIDNDSQLDSIEETILFKLEHGSLDCSEGSIFNKIREELKTRKARHETLIDNCPAPIEKFQRKTSSPKVSLSPKTISSPAPATFSTKKALQKPKKNFIAKNKEAAKNTPKRTSPGCQKLQPKVTRSAPSLFTIENVTVRRHNPNAVFASIDFTKPPSPMAAFEKKTKNSSTSLWMPFMETPSTSAPSINSAFEHDCNSNDEITLCIENQCSQVRAIGACQVRIRDELNEMMTQQENMMETTFAGSVASSNPTSPCQNSSLTSD